MGADCATEAAFRSHNQSTIVRRVGRTGRLRKPAQRCCPVVENVRVTDAGAMRRGDRLVLPSVKAAQAAAFGHGPPILQTDDNFVLKFGQKVEQPTIYGAADFASGQLWLAVWPGGGRSYR